VLPALGLGPRSITDVSRPRDSNGQSDSYTFFSRCVSFTETKESARAMPWVSSGGILGHGRISLLAATGLDFLPPII
jgi:hypothetical protein